jgi:hypothetical protein
MQTSEEITLKEWQDIMEKKLDKFYLPPPIGGLAPNAKGMPKILSKMMNISQRHKNVSAFLDFLKDCSNQFNNAQELVNKLEKSLSENKNIYKIMFGLQKDNLNQLVIEIQSTVEWANINAGSMDLLPLNSHCPNKNRKKLLSWLFSVRPTKGLSFIMKCDDKIKKNITQIMKHVQSGQEYMNEVLNDPVKAKIEGDLFLKDKIFSGIDDLQKLMKNAESKMNQWEGFLNAWMNKSDKDKECLLITVNKLMEWREERHIKRNIIKIQIEKIHELKKLGINNEPSISMPLTLVLPERWKRIVIEINEDGLITSEVQMSEKEILREIEADKLKSQIAKIYSI